MPATSTHCIWPSCGYVPTRTWSRWPWPIMRGQERDIRWLTTRSASLCMGGKPRGETPSSSKLGSAKAFSSLRSISTPSVLTACTRPRATPSGSRIATASSPRLTWQSLSFGSALREKHSSAQRGNKPHFLFPQSPGCPGDDRSAGRLSINLLVTKIIIWFFRSLAAAETGYTTRMFEEDGMAYWRGRAQERHEGRWYAGQRTHLAGGTGYLRHPFEKWIDCPCARSGTSCGSAE